MLISEFARATSLSRDTIRFYVRLGLFRPRRGARGGRSAYQEFTPDDLKAATLVRYGQSIGLSLADIGALESERRAGRIDASRRIEILRGQLISLERQQQRLAAATAHISAKIDWWSSGGRGTRPMSTGFDCSDGE